MAPLVDTNYHHALAWYRALRSHGHTVQMWEIHRHIGMGGDQIVSALLGEEVEKKEGEGIRAAEGDAYGELIGEVVPMGGARGLAGISTLAVLTGGFSEDELYEAGAAEVVRSIAELRDDCRALQALAS